MSTQVTELAIVKRIMAKLKLGDAGKLGNFFVKQVKNSEKAIRDLNRNKVTLKNQYNDDVEDFKDRIEDATEALTEAYDNVTPDNVINNAVMLEFEGKYWSNINRAKAKLADLEEKLTDLKEEYEEAVEAIDEEIALHEERISVLKGK